MSHAAPDPASADISVDPAIEPSGLGYMLRAFRHRNYRLFFAGQLVSLVGTFLSQVAVVWLIYSLTHEAWLLGVAGFVGQVPIFLLAPVAGVWVDRVDRRRLLVITQALAMLQSLALGLLALTGHIGVSSILALACFQGFINAFDMPGRQAFLVEMVEDRRDLANAIALNSTMVHGARLVGPALAGFLLYWVGAAWCFLVDGASYAAVIAALLAMTVRPRPRADGARRTVLADLKEGLAYVWGFVPIRVLLIVMAVLSLTGIPALTTLMPIFGDYFGGREHGSRALGFLMGASGLGALAGAIYLAGRRTVVGLGRVIGFAAGVLGLSLVAFSLSRTYWLSLLIVAAAGWATMTTFASANTLLQTLVDDDKRGRVMSFFSMSFIGMAPFGNLLAGTLASVLGARDDVRGATRVQLLTGLVCFAAAGAFMWMLPSLRAMVRPVYVRKGILPEEVAVGMETATEMVAGPEGAG
jgi:MFS family permease